MITNVIVLLSAFGMGLGLGAMYLGTLWLLVQRLSRTNHASLWLLSTAIPRIVLVLAALYWIADGQWEELLACVLGLVVARLAATRWASAGDGGRPANSSGSFS